MRLIKIGLGNANPTVGAFAANVDQCIEMARAMAADNVTVALFPEQIDRRIHARGSGPVAGVRRWAVGAS